MNASGSNPIVYGPASGTRTINGNLTISGNASDTITLQNLIIKGDLIVNTPSATINNYAMVEGSTTIQNVADGTWNEYASNNSLVVNDPDGIVLNVQQNATVKNVQLNTKTTLNLQADSTIGTLEVKNAESVVTNGGIIANLVTNEKVTIDGKAPETVKGTGNISGESVTAAPKDGKTEIALPKGFDVKNVKYKAYRLWSENTQTEKLADLLEVKNHIDKTYGVSFNANALVWSEESLKIDGTLLTTADWNKVKTNGKKEIPYRISILDKDGNLWFKIAMYQDGKAVIESQQ
ncbi:hypothetical protein [Exiguobacterium sp. s196]|uniref:hypothetical protein n=1 Tax=Exiguobacterium sp. s196 TaxID=2751283 RepID=UPI001BE9F521|nr:hypothetical protein [Exiguobacterium sp. s196]